MTRSMQRLEALLKLMPDNGNLIRELVQQHTEEAKRRTIEDIRQQVLYDDFLREPYKERVLESIERVETAILLFSKH